MKRFLSILVAVAMLLSVCAFSAVAEGPVVINFWHSFSSGTNLECIEKIIADFNELNAGKYEVVGTFQGNYADILSKLSIAYQSGESPACSFCDSVDTPQLVANGMVMDLTKYAAEHDAEFDFGQYIPGLMNYGTGVDGDFYALPCGRSTPLMYVNLDILEAATGSTEVPSTREGLVTALEAVRDNTDKTPFMCPMICWYFANFLTSSGGHFLSTDGETAYFKVNDDGLKAFSFWKDLADQGLYKAPTVDGASSVEQFINGDVAFIYESTGNLNNVYKNATFNFTAAYLVQDECFSVATGGNNLIVMDNVTDEEKAGGWEFIKYATSLEVNAFVNAQTGYMLNNVNSAELESVQTLWAEKPLFKVAYDQLQYVDDQYVSIYFASLNLEIVALLQQMLQDGSMSAQEAYDQLLVVCDELLPGGNAETYPAE